jgi:hypothetical protein
MLLAPWRPKNLAEIGKYVDIGDGRNSSKGGMGIHKLATAQRSSRDGGVRLQVRATPLVLCQPSEGLSRRCADDRIGRTQVLAP